LFSSLYLFSLQGSTWAERLAPRCTVPRWPRLPAVFTVRLLFMLPLAHIQYQPVPQ
jgi:hypothetical protein